MITVQTEIAEKVTCICCGAEKYATQSPYLCHNCWKNGEAAKLIQQLTQRAPDAAHVCGECGEPFDFCAMGHYDVEKARRG